MRRRLTVAVGSANPVKVNSVRAAFEANFPSASIEVFSHEVSSGVPDQPWGDAETRQGALARAQNCRAAHAAAHGGTLPDFAVGLEGGVVEERLAELHAAVEPPPPACVITCFAFMAILGGATPGEPPRWGIARTASFPLPPRIVDLMRGEGGRPPMELGDADDAVFNEVNSKQKGGTVAKATKGMIDRTAYYLHALHCALAPFVHDESGLYSGAVAPAAAQGPRSGGEAGP